MGEEYQATDWDSMWISIESGYISVTYPKIYLKDQIHIVLANSILSKNVLVNSPIITGNWASIMYSAL